jgi:hypothetical protein
MQHHSKLSGSGCGLARQISEQAQQALNTVWGFGGTVTVLVQKDSLSEERQSAASFITESYSQAPS